MANGMVDINELYITPDNKKIILDISVKKKKYYKDVYLDSVIIDTQDTFVESINAPSDEWILKRKISGEDYIAKVAWETGKVDEYLDIICTLQNCGCNCHCHNHHHKHDCCSNHHYHDCGCHNGCNDDCNCHNHCGCNDGCCNDVCHCRTGETGHYANPYSVKAIDLENKVAIDPDGIEFPLDEGAFYKFVIKEEEEETEEENEGNENNEENTESNETSETAETDESERDLFIKDNGDIYMYNGRDMTLYIDGVIPVNVKHARIEIRQEDLCRPLSDTMFFVYIKCRGKEEGSLPIVSPDCPCGQDSIYTMGVVINNYTIYRRFMCLMRELLNTCDIPKEFIDLYLRWQSVKICIETGHYTEAILYWKRFFLFKHQRPLHEMPQYIKTYNDIHPDMYLPESNYSPQYFGWGGSLFNGGCKKCGR